MNLHRIQNIRRSLRKCITAYFILAQSLGLGFFQIPSLPLLSALPAHAAIPTTLGYQGRLKNSSGNPLTGTFTFTFRLYDALSGGNLLWTEVQPGIATDSGFFSAELGSVTPFPSTMDFNEPLFLSSEVNSDGEMSPRATVNSVAYAYTSGGINSLPSAPVSATGGRMYYNTATGELNYYDQTAALWRTLGTATGTLQSVTDGGNSTTNPIQFAGGTSTGPFVFSGGVSLGAATATSLTISGTTPSSFTNLTWINATGTNTTSTNLFASSFTATTASSTNLYAITANFATATVAGRSLCLSDGTNCVTTSLVNETLAQVTTRGSFATNTLQFYGGFLASSSTVTSTLSVLGSSSLQNLTATNATATTLFASTISGTAVTSTNLYAITANFATATVAGRSLCLSDGTNCVSTSLVNETLAQVSNRGSFATNTLQFYGGFLSSSSTVTSTLTVLGTTNLQGLTATNVTATTANITSSTISTLNFGNATGTNLFAVNGAFNYLTINGATPSVFTNLSWTNATGTNTTSTNLFASSITATTASSTNLYAITANFATATVAGRSICLSDGTNCVSSSLVNETLAQVANRGSFATNTLQFFGGFLASSSTVTSTFTVLGTTNLQNLTFNEATGTTLYGSSITGTTVSSTNLFAVTGNFATATVAGRSLCLSDGTNCVSSSFVNETLAQVSNRGAFATATLQFFGGFLTASSTVTSTFTVLGTSNLQTIIATNATVTNMFATIASSTNLFSTNGSFSFLNVNGTAVCLQNGINCPSGTVSDLQTVTNAGNTTTRALQFAGGTSTANFLPSYDATFSL